MADELLEAALEGLEALGFAEALRDGLAELLCFAALGLAEELTLADDDAGEPGAA